MEPYVLTVSYLRLSAFMTLVLQIMRCEIVFVKGHLFQGTVRSYTYENGGFAIDHGLLRLVQLWRKS